MIQERIIQIIQSNVETNGSIEINQGLDQMDIDSLIFIKIIIAIEEVYGIEFEDEKLIKEAFPTVKSLIEYVIEKCEKIN